MQTFSSPEKCLWKLVPQWKADDSGVWYKGRPVALLLDYVVWANRLFSRSVHLFLI